MDFTRIVESRWFNAASLLVIVVNAVLIGVETYTRTALTHGLQWACVWLFVAEIVVRFLGRRSTGEFLRDGWNWFDIIVTGAAFVPEFAGAGTILRVLRVLRILRLVRSIPELRLIVSVLARSLASMTYIGLLMAICFYVFAVLGHKLFGARQPEFATLHESLFTLFGSLTLEGWTDLRNRGLEAGAGYLTTTLFHCVWVILATFLLVNLIVGAVINNYQEVQEIESRGRTHGTRAEIDARILELSKELHSLLRLRAKGSGSGDDGV